MPAFWMISSDIPASSIGSSALSAPASAAYACNTKTQIRIAIFSQRITKMMKFAAQLK